MLERYFVKPETIERIRTNYFGDAIERYVTWLDAQGYSARNVYRRVPLLCQFGEFVEVRASAKLEDAFTFIEPFAQYWLALHGKRCRTETARYKVLQEARGPLNQMWNLYVNGEVKPRSRLTTFPFSEQAPRFGCYLTQERGLQPSTIKHYHHYLRLFEVYLKKLGAALSAVSPPLLAGFVVAMSVNRAPNGLRDMCGVVRVFLRYCHREGVLNDDLSAAIELPQSYRLADIPRSITWEQVRCLLQTVDRRAALGKRDYAILLLLVTYGLRAGEVVKLTTDDIDWTREQFQVPARKAGHWTVYPLANVVAEAIIDYLKNGRPETDDNHLFFRVLAPRKPITSAAISSGVARYLRKANIDVHRPGAHTLRHTCVQRLIDAEFPLKTVGDYVGHRSPSSTEIYTKVALSTLRNVALGDGEAL